MVRKTPPPARQALMVLAALLLLAPVCGAGQPTRTSIVLDGSFDDWQTVLANPFNTVLDGDGSSVPCPESLDRDCIVSSAGADVHRAAVTWDDRKLYLYVERVAAANNKVFLLYVDTGHDGRFGAEDYVLEHLFKASQNRIEPAKRHYLPLAPGGDPTEDALGFGDGYTPPGGASGPLAETGTPLPCDICTSGDGLAFEFAWPWTTLGLPRASAVIYHLSAGGSATGVKEDNVGGPGDRRGSTGYNSHTISAPLNQSVGPGEILWMTHRIQNDGNLPDLVNLEIASSLGMQVCIYEDPERDSVPNNLMACDRQGNESWADSGDFVDPAYDRDADTRPDTGVLSPGEVFYFIGEIAPTNKHNRQIERTRYRAYSAADPLLSPWVRDETAVGYVTVIPRREQNVVPRATIALGHWVANHLQTRDVFDILYESSQGWDYVPWSDPDGDGDPSDGVPLFDTDGDTDPDVNIPADDLFPIALVGTIPPDTPLGTLEILTVRARATGSLTGQVEDEILVTQMVDLRPEHTTINNMAKAGSANYPTFFRHYLTWNGDAPARFDLSALSSRGYAVDFFTDPNQDGNPADGELLAEPARSPTLAPFGGTCVFLLRVSIPPGEAGGIIDSTDVYALQAEDPLIFSVVRDETRVTLIQAFEDDGHTVAVSHASVCSTVYARATGMVPSTAGTYRIVWDDPTGLRVRIAPFSSDAGGEGFDSLVFGPDALLGPWTVALQEYTGPGWTDLDRTVIELENEGVMDSLYTSSDFYSLADTSVTATAVFRNNGVADLGPLEIGFRILTPDESLFLKKDGTFRDYTGREATWILNNLRLSSGESVRETFSVVDLVWPVPGAYVLEAFWENTCGLTVAETRREFFVVADADDDGLLDDVEWRNGLDWNDRDTDDDGLIDGFEGLADTDGDTRIDSLDCDSDGDGLPDSLEAGLVAGDVEEDTDLGAGCFVADGDAGATVTERLVADTDEGGVLDGLEDVNANGIVDAGEKDPTQAWDDPCLAVPPPEITGLRVARIAGILVLGWDNLGGLDPCVAYRVWEAPSLVPLVSELTAAQEGIGAPTWARPDEGGPRSFLIQATTTFAGDGPLGYREP